MNHLVRWSGSTEPSEKAGTGHFVIEGREFAIPLPSFEAAQQVDNMLWIAFCQGKQFALRALTSHISSAVKAAESAHALSMDLNDLTYPRGVRDTSQKQEGGA